MKNSTDMLAGIRLDERNVQGNQLVKITVKPPIEQPG